MLVRILRTEEVCWARGSKRRIQGARQKPTVTAVTAIKAINLRLTAWALYHLPTGNLRNDWTPFHHTSPDRCLCIHIHIQIYIYTYSYTEMAGQCSERLISRVTHWIVRRCRVVFVFAKRLLSWWKPLLEYSERTRRKWNRHITKI
jgi:hypothetical protein